MKQTQLLMGIPITVEIVDEMATEADFSAIYDYFKQVDERFSTYKKTSEISRVNDGLSKRQWSEEMKTVLELCEQTKRETRGYFDIMHEGRRDPSGLVKGWAIRGAADKLAERGLQNYYIDAGGDIQVSGSNTEGKPWRVGIRNPFNREEVIKTVAVSTEGVATSGTYIRGQHIYNPRSSGQEVSDIVSITVIGPNIYDADRFATAAYAMGRRGIEFIEKLPGYEAYMIGQDKQATLTSGFERYVAL